MSIRKEECPFCPFKTFIIKDLHSQECKFYSKYIEAKKKHSKEELQKPEEKNPESLFLCNVCYNHFDTKTSVPKTLPLCGHTFCEKCIRNISDKNLYFRCPACRFKYRTDIDSLPTNHAMLEINLPEIKESEICKAHKMKYMAYCLDDELLLCGACTIDHRIHRCKLLEDNTIEQECQNKKEKLRENLGKLKEKLQFLHNRNLKISKKTAEIETQVKKEYEKISVKKKKEIEDLQANISKCISEVNEKQKSEGYEKLDTVMTCYKFNLKLINDDISTLENKFNDFSALSIIDQLTKPALKSMKMPFISVNNIATDQLLTINTEILYKRSIQEGKICYADRTEKNK